MELLRLRLRPATLLRASPHVPANVPRAKAVLAMRGFIQSVPSVMRVARSVAFARATGRPVVDADGQHVQCDDDEARARVSARAVIYTQSSIFVDARSAVMKQYRDARDDVGDDVVAVKLCEHKREKGVRDAIDAFVHARAKRGLLILQVDSTIDPSQRIHAACCMVDEAMAMAAAVRVPKGTARCARDVILMIHCPTLSSSSVAATVTAPQSGTSSAGPSVASTSGSGAGSGAGGTAGRAAVVEGMVEVDEALEALLPTVRRLEDRDVPAIIPSRHWLTFAIDDISATLTEIDFVCPVTEYFRNHADALLNELVRDHIFECLRWRTGQTDLSHFGALDVVPVVRGRGLAASASASDAQVVSNVAIVHASCAAVRGTPKVMGILEDEVVAAMEGDAADWAAAGERTSWQRAVASTDSVVGVHDCGRQRQRQRQQASAARARERCHGDCCPRRHRARRSAAASRVDHPALNVAAWAVQLRREPLRVQRAIARCGARGQRLRWRRTLRRARRPWTGTVLLMGWMWTALVGVRA
jgi:hypothetical protein